jgi:hypothetical protein
VDEPAPVSTFRTPGLSFWLYRLLIGRQPIHRQLEIAHVFAIGVGEGDHELIDPFRAARSVAGTIAECPVIGPDDGEGSDRLSAPFADQGQINAARHADSDMTLAEHLQREAVDAPVGDLLLIRRAVSERDGPELSSFAYRPSVLEWRTS